MLNLSKGLWLERKLYTRRYSNSFYKVNIIACILVHMWKFDVYPIILFKAFVLVYSDRTFFSPIQTGSFNISLSYTHIHTHY